ncbi:MAG: TIR domain-containing protein, partial [Planctomycetaceae bacterium]
MNAENANCPQCGSKDLLFSRRRNAYVCEHCRHEFAAPTTSEPLRIFLSYGHDGNEELVRRIRRDLEKRGHDVWFDKSDVKDRGIVAGDDWRRAITDGILKSNRVLSFLSRYSTRDPGVCRDEIAIAIGVKGGNIQTILVESEQEVQPPVNVGYIQWLDMHDWKERHGVLRSDKDERGNVYTVGDAEWEQWYQAKFDEIIRVVESDESRRFAGEIEMLSGHLKPIKSEARIGRLLSKGFYGRQWLFEAVEKWRQDTERNSRLFWIMGTPGVGKSSFAAQLTHTRGDTVIAAQFCDWNMADHRDARRIIRSLAFQMATRLPDYRKLLLTLPEIADVDRKDTAELFDYLIANPLRSVIDGGRHRFLIVIDALDEAGDGGRNPLVEILARNAEHLPDWLGFVVTSRPESDVITPLQGLNPFVFDTISESNRRDIRDYVHLELVSQLQDRTDADLLIEEVLQKSEGVFLYAERFCDDIQHGSLSLDHPEQFPQGLGGIFCQYFQRQFTDLARFSEFVLPALRVILAAREPMPMELLQRIFNWRSEERIDLTRTLGSLFPVTTDAGFEVIQTYHRSLSDWLVDKDLARSYAVDVAKGHADLVVWLWPHRHLPPLTSSAAAYSIKHLPMHLLKSGDGKGLHRLLNEDLQSWLHYWVEQGGTADGNDCIEYLLKHLHQSR